MQAPTNGFFYVLDRETGKLISAEKTGKVTWAERIDLETGRPVEAPDIRYENRRDDHLAGRAGRAQLAGDVVQPGHRAGLHPVHAARRALHQGQARRRGFRSAA